MVGSMDPDRFIDHWLKEDFKEIYNATSKVFQGMVSRADFIQMGSSFNAGVQSYQLVSQTNVLNVDQFVWVDHTKAKAVVVGFDEKHTIASLYLKPYFVFPETDKIYTKNEYIMPVMDEWFVFWGGTNEFINYHYAYEHQRYAYDLLKVKDGSTYNGRPEKNESYYAFGAEVIAPQDGTVIQVVDDLDDNIPGQMDEEHPPGNYIVIEHAHKEYSMIAHFKKDTIIVKEGEQVRQKQLLGKCGNSGNSSEAHIHFQISNSGDWQKGKSIRIRFKNGVEPIQGEIITNHLTKYHDRFEEKFVKVEHTMTIADYVFAIPRAIIQLFK
ncbi:peptidoglycan DD-metalloendopeptidase family protein [Cytobacillus kochii]